MMGVKFLICGFIIAIASIYYRIKFLQIENVVFNIESYPISSVGEATKDVPLSCEGVIEPKDGKTISSLYMRLPCVYFHYIEEIKQNKSWKIAVNMAMSVPFYIKDEKGKILVDLANVDDDFSNYKIPLSLTDKNVPNPQNSEIDCVPVAKRTSFRGWQAVPKIGEIENKRKFSLANLTLPFSLSDRRVSEFILPAGIKVFCHGMVVQKNNELVLKEDKDCPLIISRKNPRQYVEEFYVGENFIYSSCLLIALGYTIIILSLNYLFPYFFVFTFLPYLTGGNVIILISLLFTIYNRIITLKQRALNALSNIEVELKRRNDLIPNLVEIIKQYSKYEEEIQQFITEARANITFSSEIKRESPPVISSLIGIFENYPQIKALENFKSLMTTLTETENRISYSREFYNRTIRKYNTIVDQFPFLLISLPLGMKKMDFISIERGGAK